MNDAPIGRVFIKVWPNTKGFGGRVKRDLKLEHVPDFPVNIKPDWTGFSTLR